MNMDPLCCYCGVFSCRPAPIPEEWGLTEREQASNTPHHIALCFPWLPGCFEAIICPLFLFQNRDKQVEVKDRALWI